MASAKASNDEGTNDKQPPSPKKTATASKTPPAAKRPAHNVAAAGASANRKTSAGHNAAASPAGVRKTSAKRPVEPTLLGDFLLGRPSPARQAAARQKNASAAAVKQEIRQQMRQDNVRRVQKPGGVQFRVKEWQKTNAAAMAKGNPEDAASEPTEVAVQVDQESVTEEDRVRIKFREKPRQKSPVITPAPPAAGAGEASKTDKSKKTQPANTRPKPAPKKKIVSDDDWVKRNRSTSPPKLTVAGIFGIKASPNPPNTNKGPVQSKIKDWAMKVELPATPIPPEIPEDPSPPHEDATKCGDTIIVEEEGDASTMLSNRESDCIIVEEDGASSSRTWRTESGRLGADGIRIRPMRDKSPNVGGDERMNIKPTRKREPAVFDDGIRVKPVATSPLPDDGIRVRPMDGPEPGPVPRTVSKGKPTRKSSPNRGHMTSEEGAIPKKKSRSDVSASKRRRATAPATTVTGTSITQSDDDESWTSEESDSEYETEILSSAPPQTLADIPFGNSAFSELDLPVGADHHHIKRPKPQRNTSFKVVPQAFKKIMTGAKGIVQDSLDPPKPVVNQPPNIERWLDGTVDALVDNPTPKEKSVEKDWEREARRRSMPEVASKPVSSPAQSPVTPQLHKDSASKLPVQPEYPDLSPQQPAGLKRSKATRVNVSPTKQSTTKIPLREALGNLFRGESSGHKIPTKAYSSYQDTETDYESSYLDFAEENTQGDPHVRSVDPQKRPLSPESSYVSTDVSSTTEGPYMTSAIPRYRPPPPTNGQYELSTIMSEGSESTLGSETISVLSESTVTQTTSLTRSSAISRRNKGGGLKRRLTKHSDLVSVLSLPDDDRPVRSSSIKSTSSLRRRTSNLQKVTADDLLEEFGLDEDLYRRELRTLVEGAIPVLLKQGFQGGEGRSSDLLAASTGVPGETLGKAVVQMGIALEKLQHLHQRAPLNNVDKILTWVFMAYPVYDKYLDVWRLGFEGIVVNLAPAPGRLDDEDSLVNALPRNADGDVVDTEGHPVDLQRLLLRPLARIRGLLKLLKGARAIGIKHPELDLVIEDFATLQEKARRRYREEVARKTDEDAANTDTSRCCDLRTLKPLDGVLIDPSRQVNAKDFFSLDLSHSTGQRIECQVELIYRDKPKDPKDRGDVLIRDTGHARFCLLFPPIPKSAVSARRGDQPGTLVLMIRGRHNGKEWYELMTLSSDLDEQILDWIDMLGTTPVPPTTVRIATKDISGSSPRQETGVPLGERLGSVSRHRTAAGSSHARTSSTPEDQPKSVTPSRYHARRASTPSRPVTPPDSASRPQHSASPERTPTQRSYERRSRPRSLQIQPEKLDSAPLRDDMRPDPKKLTKSPPNSKPFREDGAPPPPVHRTLSSGKQSPLGAPVELAPAPRIRRRGSSPLKHEYRPSDLSSSSSEESESESESEFESSGDELDEADVPDTQPAISIKQSTDASVVDSVVSEDSIAPSQSASQVGLYGRLGPGGAKAPEYTIKAIASISYWSDKKGQWGDAWPEECSIVVTPGLIEAYPLSLHSVPGTGALDTSGSSEAGHADLSHTQPLIALELTPIVMIRQSTIIDLEIRSPVRPYCKLAAIDGKIFRFRASSAKEGSALYMAVHKARLNNAKYKALEEEARFRSFGQHETAPPDAEGQSSSTNRRSWFSRKNSYRASTRAPSQSASQSQGTSSSLSAPSLFRRLTGGGSTPFNIDRSSVNRRSTSRPTTAAGSLYTSGSSSSGNMTPPRSPSVSLAETSGRPVVLGTDNLKVRCHLLVTPTKWEDYGNCMLQITRPPPGMRQELRIRHGMEKRVIVTKIPKKIFGFGDNDASKANPVVVLDVVLGSKCFGRLGARGIILNVWEDLRDEQNNVGHVPKTGGLAGTVKKWCFQCSSSREANWIFGLVAQEVDIAMQ